MSTIKELKEFLKGHYVDVKVFEPLDDGNPPWSSSLHIERCRLVNNYTDNKTVRDYELLGEEEYNKLTAICINDYVDFEKLYGDKNAKVLCIIFSTKYDIDRDNYWFGSSADWEDDDDDDGENEDW